MAKVPITRAFVLGSTSAVAQALCQEQSQRGCRRIHRVTRDREGISSLDPNCRFEWDLARHLLC